MVRVSDVSNIIDLPYVQDTAIIIPNREQYASANSHHLFSLGFIYYNQISHIPEGWRTLPLIVGNEADLSRFCLPPDYVVITPNATADNRRLSSESLNAVIHFMRKKGTTPVLLGKKEVAGDYSSRADGGLTLDGVIDLREKTTLREAACVMAGSRLTFGPDNGLLHLASCGPSPTVWVFTSVDPALRLPPRPYPDAKTSVITPPESLSCRFCQSRMRYVIGHDFKNCLYKDNACVRDLSGPVLVKILSELWGNL